MTGTSHSGKRIGRGRSSRSDWSARARYVLRHLDDPIALERSPLCRLAALDRLARQRYPQGILPRGRTLRDLAALCLEEIEAELDGHAGVAKLKAFAALTRQGSGVTEASRAIGISPEYATRALKSVLVRLLGQKLQIKLR